MIEVNISCITSIKDNPGIYKYGIILSFLLDDVVLSVKREISHDTSSLHSWSAH